MGYVKLTPLHLRHRRSDLSEVLSDRLMQRLSVILQNVVQQITTHGFLVPGHVDRVELNRTSVVAAATVRR